MRKGLTELVMILDRSGSIRGLEADAIGGFNGMLEKQKKEEDEAMAPNREDYLKRQGKRELKTQN